MDLFALFAAAKVGGELFEALRQPQVVGELLAGVLIGPHVLGLVGGEGEIVLEVIAELGVIILLFTVGLETSVNDLRQVGTPALLVGILGIALPFLASGGLMAGLGFQREEVLFVTAALVATSVGITARVLRDLGAVRLSASRVILGAAVVDDILAIVVLAVVAGLAADGFSTVKLVVLVLEVLVFLGVVVAFGPRVVRLLSGLAHTPLIPRSPLAFALLLTLGLAALSGVIGLASLIGAFLAGVIFEFSREEVTTRIQPVYELLVPFFFAITGTQLDPTVFGEPGTLGLAAVITVIAVATKVLGGYLGAAGLGGSGRLAVGVGMVPRGEVGLIVASLGLGLGVISRDVFGVVVAMLVVTTLMTPPVLGPVVRREKERLWRARTDPGVSAGQRLDRERTHRPPVGGASSPAPLAPVPRVGALPELVDPAGALHRVGRSGRHDPMRRRFVFGSLRDRLRYKAARAVKVRQGGLVLDLGCGTGRLGVLLADRVRVVGLDVDHFMLRNAQRLVGDRMHLVRGIAFKLPFRDGAFDGAISTFILRLMTDLESAFNELARVLAPGGQLVLVDVAEPRRLFKSVFRYYFGTIAPSELIRVGELQQASGQRVPVRSLVRQLARQTETRDLLRLLEQAGFRRSSARTLMAGTAVLITAER